jgi:hypothetical protein
MSTQRDDLKRAFAESSTDTISAARRDALATAGPTLRSIADAVQTLGWVQRDDRLLAVALLSRLASELADGILALVESRPYAAGCLLRQLIEIEYLIYLGYTNPETLAEWYKAEEDDLRKRFSPQQMRRASDGLFRDEEYWLHCNVGGHPNPKARILLSSYQQEWDPIQFLLPDSLHHLRRLWTSLSLMLPKLGIDESIVPDALSHALEVWVSAENPMILSYDGIPT